MYVHTYVCMYVCMYGEARMCIYYSCVTVSITRLISAQLQNAVCVYTTSNVCHLPIPFSFKSFACKTAAQ